MDLKITFARGSDLDTIQSMNRELFDYEYSLFNQSLVPEWSFSEEARKWFESRIKKRNGCVIIARDGKSVAGYLLGNIEDPEKWRKASRVAEIENLVISKNYRGKGIGKKLCEKFSEWCKSKKIERIKLVVLENNERTIKFYKDVGFTDYSKTMEMEL
jgi:ribosomal protein S18 acetylase RimI-like enzyme